jgi:AraC-like DNA-binding protein
LEEYLAALGASADAPVIALGDDLQIVLLFNEVLKSLQQGGEFPQLLLAAHALGQLLALAMQNGRKAGIGHGGGLQKVAQCITYMSEHLERPLKISEMAALASLSPAHFTALFKEQTGSAPRDYLHFLRMHQACQWLTGTTWSLKEIANRLGYQDQFHFSRKFKAFSGASPSAYRHKAG